MTSAVTFRPLAFASRIKSADLLVDTWHTCSLESVSSVSIMSLAIIDSSARAGQPARPRREDKAPSFI